MITVTGRVVDEQGTPVAGVQVVALGDWLLTSEKLTKPLNVNNDGRFTLKIESVESVEAGEPGTIVPSFRVRVIDLIGRQLSDDKLVPGTAPTHDLNDITVHRTDKDGLAVTNLTGAAKFVSDGNAIKLLVDGLEAFGRIADEIKLAQHSINMTQLFFSLPDKFDKDNEAIDPETKEPKEKAKLVFKFSPAPLVPIDPAVANSPKAPAPRIGDERPERLLVDKLLKDKTLVRILLDTTDVDKAKKYFGLATAAETVQRIIIHGFRQVAPDNGVQHCKMMIVDEKRAVVVGSPFSQRYFDSLVHRIDDPHRGGNTSDMVHDLSMAVVGPAAHDLFETFRLYWNEDVSQPEKLPALPDGIDPNAQTSGEDAISRVQVVRTLSGKRFSGLNGKSEKGILEGYLRAFAAAKHYIYLENQYFTDSVITDALVEALKAKPDLELILVVPIKPDVIFYPRRQAKRIEQLRKAGGDRVGVFTRWTYDGKRPNNARPWVAPVYIHAKGAVVDDSWATVGSANLDGLSLDYNLLLSPLVFGETTACELNINVLPSATGSVNPFAQLMRRRLFAEHLGLIDANGIPNPQDPNLVHGPEHKWLKELWRPTAERALAHVKNATRADLRGFVLEYPKEDGGWLDTPRKHLAALGVELTPSKAVIRPITGTRKFHFSTGKWDVIPEREDIKQ